MQFFYKKNVAEPFGGEKGARMGMMSGDGWKNRTGIGIKRFCLPLFYVHNAVYIYP